MQINSYIYEWLKCTNTNFSHYLEFPLYDCLKFLHHDVTCLWLVPTNQSLTPMFPVDESTARFYSFIFVSLSAFSLPHTCSLDLSPSFILFSPILLLFFVLYVLCLHRQIDLLHLLSFTFQQQPISILISPSKGISLSSSRSLGSVEGEKRAALKDKDESEKKKQTRKQINPAVKQRFPSWSWQESHSGGRPTRPRW